MKVIRPGYESSMTVGSNGSRCSPSATPPEPRGVRGEKPLTYRAASQVLVLEAGLVVAVLSVVVAGAQLPDKLIALRPTPAAVLITLLWIVGLLLRRAGRSLRRDHSGRRHLTAGGLQRPDSGTQRRLSAGDE
jgi:hypothetical protein